MKMKNSIDKILTNKSFNFWKKKYNIGSFFSLTCNVPNFKSCFRIRTFSVSIEIESFDHVPDTVFHQNSTYIKWFFYKFNMSGEFRFAPNKSGFPEKSWRFCMEYRVKEIERYEVEVMQHSFLGMGSINVYMGDWLRLNITKKSHLEQLILFFDLFHFALSPEKKEEFGCFKEAMQVYHDNDISKAEKTQKLIQLQGTRGEIKAKYK